jgi:chromosome segregation ATPase
MGIGREAIQRETSIHYEAGQQISAARALGEDLDEMEALAAQLLTLRNRVRIKARALHTTREMGDAQTSEAELVAAPLRVRIAELESQVSGQIELDLRDRIAELESQVPSEIVTMTDECLTVGRLNRQLDVALSQVSALQRRKEELHGRVANLVEWLDLRNGELASANEQRDQARAEAERLEALLASRDTALVESRELAASLQRDLDTMADTLKGREEQIREWRQERDQALETEGRMRHIASVRLGEIDSLNTRLDVMTAERDAQQQDKQRAWEKLATIEAIAHRPGTDEGMGEVAHRPNPGELFKALFDIRESLKGFS